MAAGLDQRVITSIKIPTRMLWGPIFCIIDHFHLWLSEGAKFGQFCNVDEHPMTRRQQAWLQGTCLYMDVYKLENTPFAMEAMAMQSSIIYTHLPMFS